MSDYFFSILYAIPRMSLFVLVIAGRLLSFLFTFPYVFDCEHVFLMTVRFQQCLQITNEKEVTVEFNAIE